jgi:predicted regulator of Ras-like GTPase activity (Roadblock/LC7/MglB family)
MRVRLAFSRFPSRKEGRSMTKADQLAAALDDFLTVSPDVEAAAVVSADGLPMASALPPYVEEDRLAAMSAALVSLGERAATGLEKGDLAQVFVEGADGYVVLMAAGENAVLVAVTSKGAKVGLVLYEMRKIASNIANVMDGVAQPQQAQESHEPRQLEQEVGGSQPPPPTEGVQGWSPARQEVESTVPGGWG